MDITECCCLVKSAADGTFTLSPRTRMDKSLMEAFVEQNGQFVNVRFMKREARKTHEQDKAFWALFKIYIQSVLGRIPTKNELSWFYEKLKPDLFPPMEDVLGDGEMIPKSWSQVSKKEGLEIISKLITLVAEQYNIPPEYEASCKDIFIWLQTEKGTLDFDPTDLHPDGTPLTKAEWAAKNQLCMIRGLKGGDICHIISRKQGEGFEWLIEQPWNFYRGSHDIHIGIQHEKGWEALFSIAPWLRSRYERAKKLFYLGQKLYRDGYDKEAVIILLTKTASKQQ